MYRSHTSSLQVHKSRELDRFVFTLRKMRKASASPNDNRCVSFSFDATHLSNLVVASELVSLQEWKMSDLIRVVLLLDLGSKLREYPFNAFGAFRVWPRSASTGKTDMIYDRSLVFLWVKQKCKWYVKYLTEISLSMRGLRWRSAVDCLRAIFHPWNRNELQVW